MNKSETANTIIKNLSPHINLVANKALPVEEFHQYAQAVLEYTCHEYINTQPSQDLENMQDTILQQTIAIVETTAHDLLATLQTGKGEGRATLLCNGRKFMIDFRSDE